jgi:hypothetical protein
MRTFVVAEGTKIDVIAEISREALELERLVLSRFEGSAKIAHAAFRTLADRCLGKPLAEYAVTPEIIPAPRAAESIWPKIIFTLMLVCCTATIIGAGRVVALLN